MNLSAWRRWYRRIAKRLNLSEEQDRAATLRLSELLDGSSSVEELKRFLQGKVTMVFGAGPSLETDLKQVLYEGIPKGTSIICADGATSAFLRYAKRPPEVIVSDLDGNMEDIIHANRLGAMVLVHAHGDNILRLNEYVPLLRRPVLGTTQVDELPNVHNFGGFTDGDRAVFASEANAARLIVLGGMDLGVTVGRFSKPGLAGSTPASKRKQVKLAFARRLLESLAEEGYVDIVNCTGGGEDLRGIPRLAWRDLRKLVP